VIALAEHECGRRSDQNSRPGPVGSARSPTSKASSQSVPDSENRAAGLITPFLGIARIMLRKPTVEPEAKTFKFKICLVGEEGVGKTSLIHRFVSGAFDESYIRTLGAVVSKKTVALGSMQGRPVQVDMMILDIMGKRTFLQLFKEAYFHGAKGVLAVFDMTRQASLRDMSKWIDGVRDSVGPIPVYALGNKTDLTARREVNPEDAANILRSYEGPVPYTSAKTGHN